MIHYATVRRKKDIISLLCCADDFASFKGSIERLQFRISDRSEEVFQNVELQRYCEKKLLHCKRETSIFTANPSDT